MRALVDYFVSPDTSIKQAIAVIDRGAAQAALVVDGSKLLGIVTDGDVRRALLRGETIDGTVGKVMRKDFSFLPATASEEEALALMQRKTLYQVPALDHDGRVVRLFLLEELIKPKTLSNTVVIMAGGKGERLHPLTQNCPKPMIQVGGKPLLEIILQQCLDAGFRNFYFSVNYLKEQIKQHFENGERWNASIRYLEEDSPLGTGGALGLIPERPVDPVLVLNGDVLTRVDYGHLLRFHRDHSAAATMCVREHVTQIPYGVVQIDDIKVLSLEEKPVLTHYVNAGIYLLNTELLDLVEPNTFLDMPQLLERAAKGSYTVSAFPIHEYWLDVGQPETLERARGEWA